MKEMKTEVFELMLFLLHHSLFNERKKKTRWELSLRIIILKRYIIKTAATIKKGEKWKKKKRESVTE